MSVRLMCGSFVITLMILKTRRRRAPKLPCETVWLVADFSMPWYAVGRTQVKVCSTDSPTFFHSLPSYQMITKEAPLCSSSFSCSWLQQAGQQPDSLKRWPVVPESCMASVSVLAVQPCSWSILIQGASARPIVKHSDSGKGNFPY